MNDTKACINRSHLKTNDLKRLLIRVDFDGVTNIESFIRRLKKLYKDLFRYKKVYSRNLNNLSDSNDSLNIDAQTIREMPVHVFYYENPTVEEKLNIEISDYSICLELDCKAYTGFDRFSEMVCSCYKELIQIEYFIEIRRVAINKISAFWDEDPNAIRISLEKEAIPDPMVNEYHAQCSYSDKFYWDDYAVNVILNRNLSWGTILHKNEQKSAWQVTLNYDVSKKMPYSYNRIVYNDADLNQILHTLNDAHFELFKRSMTIDYLKNHCNG